MKGIHTSLIFFLIAILMAGCASQPDKIATTYVSELQYKDYDCDQLSAELGRVSNRAGELYTSLKKTANTDTAQVWGSLLLWPTLLFLEGGDGPEATEYARLKGEKEAIEKVTIQKKCT